MFAKSVILTAAFLVASSQAFICPPNFCERYECEAVGSCQNGRVIAKGGVCGCCDICVQEIQEGKNCDLTLLLGHQMSHVCAPGLSCDRTRIVCVRDDLAGPCHKKLLAQKDNGQLLGQFKPVCEENGYYATTQCLGSVCYCTRSNGNKISGFESPIGDRATKTCKCARDQANYRDTGLIGKMFHCDQHGNYESVQCIGSVCFCADSDGKERLGLIKKHISQKNELRCPQ